MWRISAVLALVSCAKGRNGQEETEPRPKYGDPCDPPSPGCYYLGDEITGMPMIEVFDSRKDGASGQGKTP